MGGNRFGSGSTRRLDRREYHETVADVIGRLAGCSHLDQINAAPHLGDKESFGDVDLVAAVRGLDEPGVADTFVEEVASRMGADEWALNAARSWVDKTGRTVTKKLPDQALLSILPSRRGVASFRMPKADGAVQVDLLLCDPSVWRSHLDYFSYNDLGNLLGLTAKRLGFKLTPEGLCVDIARAGVAPDRLVVTEHMDEALLFLGFDPSPFRNGFPTRETMFEYAASSPWFQASDALPSNRNADNRRRDMARPNYVAFVDWLARTGRVAVEGIPVDREAQRQRAEQHFPRLASARAAADFLAEQRASVARAFNGRRVKDWTGLQGETLGAFLAEAKAALGGQEGLTRLAREGDEAMEQAVKSVWAKRRGPRHGG